MSSEKNVSHHQRDCQSETKGFPLIYLTVEGPFASEVALCELLVRTSLPSVATRRTKRSVTIVFLVNEKLKKHLLAFILLEYIIEPD